MKKLITAVLVIASTLTNNVVGAEKVENELFIKDAQKVIDKYESKKSELVGNYDSDYFNIYLKTRQTLSQFKVIYESEGDLEKVLLVSEALKKDSGSILNFDYKSLPKLNLRIKALKKSVKKIEDKKLLSLMKLNRSYALFLKNKVKEETKKGNIKLAIAYRDEYNKCKHYVSGLVIVNHQNKAPTTRKFKKNETMFEGGGVLTKWHHIDDKFKNSSYTVVNAHEFQSGKKHLTVKSFANQVVYIMSMQEKVEDLPKGVKLTKYKLKTILTYNNLGHVHDFKVYALKIRAGQIVKLPQTTWGGSMLIFPNVD